MNVRGPHLRAFLDAGVPDSVGAVLSRHGHEVIYYRDLLAEKVPDEVVCRTALANEAILVAMDGEYEAVSEKIRNQPGQHEI